jgi:hypothetical protein
MEVAASEGMRSFKRTVAAAVAVVVFGAVFLLIVPALLAMSYLFFQTTSFPGGQPNDRFTVALKERGKRPGEPSVSTFYWRDVAKMPSRAERYSFLLPLDQQWGPGYRRFKVIEQRAAAQVIEVAHSNTYTSWSRYEAFDDRIVPISFRHTGGAIAALLPGIPILIAAFVCAVKAGRAASRLLGV